MKWTKEERLGLIKVLIVMYLERNKPTDESIWDLTSRIAFLCDMPADFLEANKQNYEDAIMYNEADISMSL